MDTEVEKMAKVKDKRTRTPRAHTTPGNRLDVTIMLHVLRAEGRALDNLVSSGRFVSRQEAIRFFLHAGGYLPNEILEEAYQDWQISPDERIAKIRRAQRRDLTELLTFQATNPKYQIPEVATVIDKRISTVRATLESEPDVSALWRGGDEDAS
jgi:hypothetical protein